MPNWEQLEPYLRSLAESLGTTASGLWAILVQRQIVSGYQDLLVAAAVLSLYSIPLFIGKLLSRYNNVQKAEKEKAGKSWDGSDYELASCAFYIGGGLVVLAMVVGVLQTAIEHLVTPEYSAFKALIDMLSAAKR